MPKFNVGITATVEVEVEANTQEEAEAFISTDEHLAKQFYNLLMSITNIVQLNNADWNIDYCEQVDEDDDDEDDEGENDDDEDDEDFKFAHEA